MLYIIEHPNAGFNGVAGGVDFRNGIGSTSSVFDAQRLVKLIKAKVRSIDPEAGTPVQPRSIAAVKEGKAIPTLKADAPKAAEDSASPAPPAPPAAEKPKGAKGGKKK